jgi:hypothetical protein
VALFEVPGLLLWCTEASAAREVWSAHGWMIRPRLTTDLVYLVGDMRKRTLGCASVLTSSQEGAVDAYIVKGVKRAVICAEIAVLELPVTSALSHTFREKVFDPANTENT